VLVFAFRPAGTRKIHSRMRFAVPVARSWVRTRWGAKFSAGPPSSRWGMAGRRKRYALGAAVALSVLSAGASLSGNVITEYFPEEIRDLRVWWIPLLVILSALSPWLACRLPQYG